MSSPKLQKVAVAGVNGALGKWVIKHLLEANFTVTALTTDTTKTAEKFGDKVAIIEADYSDVQSLVATLRGQEALVSLIGRSSHEVQNALTDAAIEAGVRHVIPSCFGANLAIPEIRASPANSTKIKAVDHVVQRAKERKIVFTGIHTNIFFEYGVNYGMFVNPHGPTLFFDNGDVPFSTTGLDDTGRAVANTLKKAGTEEVQNKFLFVQSAVLTQQKALQLAKEVRPNPQWETIPMDTKAAWEKSRKLYDEGGRDVEALRGFFARSNYGTGVGLFEPNDNDVLGIKQWDDEEIKQHIAELLKRH